MRLKTFSAPTMAKAMDQVRRDLGEDAIIVSTRSGTGGRGVSITAALEEANGIDEEVFRNWESAAPQPPDRATEISDALTFHGIPTWLRDRMLRCIDEGCEHDAEIALGDAIDATISFQSLIESELRTPLMFVGPPGAGKTVACAKAIFRARRAGRAVTAITTDTRRAGAVEQLEAFTRILDVPLAVADAAGALTEMLQKANGNLVIIDTAGSNPLNERDMQQLATLVRAARSEPVLVLPAGGDSVESTEHARVFAAVGAKRLIATKLDLSRRYGAPLTAAAGARLALAGVSISPEIADGFATINPVSLARLLLPQETADLAAPQRKEEWP